eukprot:gene25100-biopygen1424
MGPVVPSAARRRPAASGPGVPSPPRFPRHLFDLSDFWREKRAFLGSRCLRRRDSCFWRSQCGFVFAGGALRAPVFLDSVVVRPASQYYNLPLDYVKFVALLKGRTETASRGRRGPVDLSGTDLGVFGHCGCWRDRSRCPIRIRDCIAGSHPTRRGCPLPYRWHPSPGLDACFGRLGATGLPTPGPSIGCGSGTTARTELNHCRRLADPWARWFRRPPAGGRRPPVREFPRLPGSPERHHVGSLKKHARDLDAPQRNLKKRARAARLRRTQNRTGNARNMNPGAEGTGTPKTRVSPSKNQKGQKASQYYNLPLDYVRFVALLKGRTGGTGEARELPDRRPPGGGGSPRDFRAHGSARRRQWF